MFILVANKLTKSRPTDSILLITYFLVPVGGNVKIR